MLTREQEITRALEALRQAELVLCPSVTGWGLLGDATNGHAAAKLVSLPEAKAKIPPVVWVAEEREIYTLTAAPDPSLFDYLETQTDPVALCLEHTLGVDQRLQREDGSAWIGISPDLLVRHLIKRYGKPLAWLALRTGEGSLAETLQNIPPPVSSLASVRILPGEEEEKLRQSLLLRWWKGGAAYPFTVG